MSSSDSYGLVVTSVKKFNVSHCEVQWTNGLIRQTILDLDERKPHLLRESYWESFVEETNATPAVTSSLPEKSIM